MEPGVTTADLARRYSVRPKAIQLWLANGFLPAIRRGGRWYTTWDAVFMLEDRPCPLQGDAREEAKRPLLTVDDVAGALDERCSTVRRWLRNETLPGFLINNTWYVDRLDLILALGMPADSSTGKQILGVTTGDKLTYVRP